MTVLDDRPTFRLALVAAGGNTSGGMIACIPADPASLAVDGGDPPDELHVTLAYVSSDAEQLSDSDRAAIDTAAAGAVAGIGPFDAHVSGYGVLGGDDPAATVLFVEAPEFETLHARVWAELNDYGTEGMPEQHPSFVPHLTLGYGVPLEAAAAFKGTSIRFGRVSVRLGGSAPMDYELTGEGEAPPPAGDAAPAAAQQPAKVPNALLSTGAIDRAKALADEWQRRSSLERSPSGLVLPGTARARGRDYPDFKQRAGGRMGTWAIQQNGSWEGVLIVEGLPSGDGRRLAPEALTTRPLPLPLMAMFQNPDGGDGHAGAQVAGRIEWVQRRHGAESGTYEIWGGGGPGAILLQTAPGAYLYELVRQRALRGISADLDNCEVEYEEDEEADILDILFGGGGTMTLVSGRMIAATACPTPAFHEARFVMLDGMSVDGDSTLEAAIPAGGPPPGQAGPPPPPGGPQDAPAEPPADQPADAGPVEVGDEVEWDLPDGGTGSGEVTGIDEQADGGPVATVQPDDGSDPVQVPVADLRPAEQADDAPEGDDGQGEPIPGEGASTATSTVASAGHFDDEIHCPCHEAKAKARAAAGLDPDEHDGSGCACSGEAAAADVAALVASAGPVQGGATARMWTPLETTDARPLYAVVASGGKARFAIEPPSSMFDLPETRRVAPPRLDPRTGHVAGYAWRWDDCHVGVQGRCVPPPRNYSGYRFFHLGDLPCDDGKVVKTGVLVWNTVHPSLRMSASDAQAFYADTGCVAADVVVYEDRVGGYITGAARPNLTREDVRAFNAAPGASGDWRPVNRKSELMVALLVNLRGFAFDPTEALVASGGVGRSGRQWDLESAIDPGRPRVLIGANGETLAAVGLGTMAREPRPVADTPDAGALAALIERVGQLEAQLRPIRVERARARLGR